jgi:hypothetical protein
MTQNVCLAACTGTGQSTCRTGWVCEPDGNDAYCRADCNNGNLAACPQGQTCATDGTCN